MSTKPVSLVLLDDAVSHLRSALRRNRDIIPPSLAGQICGTLSHWGRQRLRRQEVIHPGMSQMGRWGSCCERQARRNLVCLRNWGVMEFVAYLKGGRRSTRYIVRPEALIRALVVQGVNLSPDLIEKLQNPDINPDIRGEENPDKNPGSMSAGIQRETGGVPPASAGEASQGGESQRLRLVAKGGRHV